ncbi:hypothetical protein VPNG_09587 [Cytospora leucostoma]|uniref:Uncharacterized protein n=1 Tax=Cytospora leucostoma TaxID=1230097 RepID=A0A423VN27_9PEZI|nr:hypothetical protein VPNG_09587 [Cytospora leucostoma]
MDKIKGVYPDLTTDNIPERTVRSFASCTTSGFYPEIHSGLVAYYPCSLPGDKIGLHPYPKFHAQGLTRTIYWQDK